MRHSLIIPDILPENLLSDTKFFTIIKINSWSIQDIARRLYFKHWLYRDFFLWLYTLIEKTNETEIFEYFFQNRKDFLWMKKY